MKATSTVSSYIQLKFRDIFLSFFVTVRAHNALLHIQISIIISSFFLSLIYNFPPINYK